MRPSRLFHTVVLVGAALGGGCGATSTQPDGGEDAGEAIADAAITDAAMDGATDPPPEDAGGEEDGMVLIL